ncbi:hypothetical protein STENM327S_00296 [Streptomyces tendae]
MAELVAQAIAEEGLKLTHHAVLAAVCEHGPVAQADLVRQLGFDAKDVVLLVNHLEDAGLALRAADPRDRRKNAVTVTPAGVQTLERCAGTGRAGQRRVAGTARRRKGLAHSWSC